MPLSIKPSTREFYRQGRRIPGYSLFDWLHGYAYARWPYLYIGVALGEHPLTRTLAPFAKWFSRRHPPKTQPSARSKKISFADTYHGKVVSTNAASKLVTLNRDIALPDLEPVIPYAKARDLLLDNPGHIAALACPCRTVRTNPCLPLDVCLIVGDPFAPFILEHHPDRARKISQSEAVDILTAEHERGHVHHAFFKDAMLERFYAICNCCPCCCGAMQAMRNGIPMLCSSGYVVACDAESCVECGACVKACPFQAVTQEGDGIRVDADKCMGCGVCVDKCPNGCLSLVRSPGKPEPLEINELLSGRLGSPTASQGLLSEHKG